MPPNDYEDLIRLIHDRFAGMRKTCLRNALFLTQDPHDIAVNPAKATVERVGTHASVTDPRGAALQEIAGQRAMLCFMGEKDQKTVQWTALPAHGAWMRRVPPLVRGTRRKATG